jgi:hypothetical protein
MNAMADFNGLFHFHKVHHVSISLMHYVLRDGKASVAERFNVKNSFLHRIFLAKGYSKVKVFCLAKWCQYARRGWN